MKTKHYRLKFFVAILPICFGCAFSEVTITFFPEQTNVVLSWTGEPEQLYSVSATSDLSSGKWTRIGDLLEGAGAEISVTNLLASREFFRVAEDAGPLTTLMWNIGTAALNPVRIINAGGNTVWLNAGNDADYPAATAMAENAGITAMPNYKVLNDPQWTNSYPQYRPRRFIASRPQSASAGGVLTLSLLDGYPAVYRMEEDVFFRPYWKVWNRTGRTLVPADSWSYTNGQIKISGAVSGHEYSAGFSIVDEDNGVTLDLFSTNAQQLILNVYQNIMDVNSSSMFRPTQFAFYFFNQLYPDGVYRDWYGPCVVLGRDFIQRFEIRFGRSFDLDDLFDFGVIRSTNDEKHAGYRDLLMFQREVAQDFALRFTEGFHQRGRKVRMFWGDSWVGLEPSSPEFVSTGFDQIVTAVTVPQDVRRLMTVSKTIRRSSRFGFWDIIPGNGINVFSKNWAAFLQAAFRDFPEGMTLGGPPLLRLMNEESGFEEYVKARFSDFKFLYRLINGKQAYVHDLKVGILNSYGALRAWPRDFTMNNSQQLWLSLTDVPVDVQWLSFDEILAGGIPSDIDVLINAGEPGSAWSGGAEWTPAVVSMVETFVQNGGTFIGVDAPGVTDNKCVLSNLLGVSYDRPGSPAAERGIFQNMDKFRRFISSETPIKQAFTLKKEIADQLGISNRTVDSPQHNTTMKPLSAAVRLDVGTNDVLFTRRAFGAGTAWYLSGAPVSKVGQKFFKRLIFFAAGEMDQLQKLDCISAGGFVYYYPEGNILIAYNNDVPNNSLKLGLNLFANSGKVRFEGLTPSAASFTLSESDFNASEITVGVQTNTFAVWRVTKEKH